VDIQTELITSKGYPCEDHTVTTADGFILGLQRIPYGKQNWEKPRPRRVVFLQHGLLDSSATWVMNLANESLGMCCCYCKVCKQICLFSRICNCWRSLYRDRPKIIWKTQFMKLMWIILTNTSLAWIQVWCR